MNDAPSNPLVDPPELEPVRYGLSRAIQLHSEAFRVKNPQIKLDLDLVEDENLLPQETCLGLYQVYLERLRQIAGGAQAKQVWIHYYPSRAHMVLDIRDDGLGASAQTSSAEMKTYIEAAGGELLVAARPDGGTTVTAKAPFTR